jgi:hypothetical protein
MLGYDQVDTLAERLLGRIAKQRRTGGVPANDRSRVVGTDDSVSDLIENPLGQFGLLFHRCAPLDWTWIGMNCIVLVDLDQRMFAYCT